MPYTERPNPAGVCPLALAVKIFKSKIFQLLTESALNPITCSISGLMLSNPDMEIWVTALVFLIHLPAEIT
jgi:hypothetical protein